MKKISLTLIVLSAPIFPGLARASGDGALSTVTATVKSGMKTEFPDDLSRMSLKYYGVYYGGSIGDLDSKVHDSYGHSTSTDQYLLNYTGIGYKVTPDLIPGITVMSTYSPANGKGFTLLDPCLRVTDTHLLHRNGWDVYDELRYYLPVTADSERAHKEGSLALFQIVTYQIPASRWTLGAWMKICWTRYGDEVASGANMQAYLKPEIFYQITPKFSASLYYEMYGAHSLGKSLANWASAGTDLQPGVIFNIAPGLALNPYVQISTGGKISVDSTSVGAQIFATII